METFNRRTPIVLVGLAVALAILVGQLLSFQLRLSSSIQDFQANASQRTGFTQKIQPHRGQIYDRDGVVLAVNTFEYRVGISPSLIGSLEARRLAALEIAGVLGLDEEKVFGDMQPNENGVFPVYVPLASPIDDPTARALEDLDISGLRIESIPLRSYPQEELMAQLIGFVNYSEQGFYGIEGYYDRLLAGTSREVTREGTFLDVSDVPDARDGQSLVLSVDRDVQYVIEQTLLEAVDQFNVVDATIIVMNPKTGEILGMLSYPFFAADEFDQVRQDRGLTSFNAAVSDIYEPGSVIKVVTAAITLQANLPNLDLNWTYNNTGCFEQVGVRICDWDRAAKGNVDFRQCIIQSLNTCTATWYTLLGPSKVYPVLREFGFGVQNGVDIQGEAQGLLREPGHPLWSEADFLNISYGQGIAISPLQMLVSVNAIANDGLMMQPHIVKYRQDGDRIFETVLTPISRPISAEVANAVTELMVEAVNVGESGANARVDGYAVAGKTGTAQQPTPGGYSNTASWASFVGFLPADDPIVSAIIVLDRPSTYWGSQSAAPIFKLLMERLVVLLEIPPDDIRLQLVNTGGRPFDRN